MFDYSHLPNVANGADTQQFTTPGWFTWVKPRGKSKVFMMLLGSGGGGGGGFSGASATARGGGGGGGSAAVTRVEFAAEMLPDVLNVFVAPGGLGGAASVAGSAGDYSAVTTSPGVKTDALARIAVSGLGAGGGGAGTAAAGGTAGTAGAVNAVTATGSLAGHASTAGQAGAVGGAQTGATGTGPGLTFVASGGASGAGVGTANADFAGGGFTAVSGFPALPGGAVAGGAGLNGHERWLAGVLNPRQFHHAVGGTGGGSNGVGTGGAGGRGGIGSGGGGGGAGVTGGRGGDGGNGMVLIVSV
jgi:hypothetical protein